MDDAVAMSPIERARDLDRIPQHVGDRQWLVVVFANTPADARVVAAEIAKKAYWNSSYFGGTFADLLAAGFINHPPVARSKAATVAAGSACTATTAPAIVDDGSFDPDSGDSLTLSLDQSWPLGLGQHPVSLIATDSHGRSSESATLVTVADASAPAISNLAVDKPVLWPPNHRMEVVTIGYTAADNCGPVTTELIVSTDRPSASAAQAGRPDWEVLDAHHVSLRVEREGSDGRIYWITVVATEGAGNRSARSAAVRVGHVSQDDEDFR